jgi:predicted permease
MGMLRRLLALGRQSKVSGEIEDELRAHLEMRIEDNMAAGMTRAEAERDARLRFGNPAVMHEHTIERDAALGLHSVLLDLHYALRGFRKSPGFAIVAIVTLALGIGANTAIFQLVDAVRLRSLPIVNPQELAEVKIVGGNGGLGITDSLYAQLTRPIWQEIQQHHDPFSGVFAWRVVDPLLGELSESRRVHALEVSSEFFRVTGLHPWMGRTLLPGDEMACTAPRVMVSYPYWKSQMGGRELTSGTQLKIDNRMAEVVGVTPPGFFGMAVGEGFDVLQTLAPASCDADSWKRDLFDIAVMGRLKPGWSLDRASSYLSAVSSGIFQATMPSGRSSNSIKRYLGFRLGAYSASGGVSVLREQYDDSLTLLLVITGLVLLIACSNLANLMLARANARQREMAVRVALGASRGRLMRQMLMESGLLALSGAGIGLLLAQFFSRILVRSLTADGSQIKLSLATDWRVLLFSASVAVLTCVVFGSVPALRASKTDPVTAMKSGDGRLAGGRERLSIQRLMVMVQIAVSMVLLVGALLFVRSFRNLMTLDPGMREHGITLVHIGFPLAHLKADQYAEFKRQLVEEVRSLPGVTNASSTTNDPLLGASWEHGVHVGVVEGLSKFTWVSPSYFQTMGIPLLTGRNFAETDTVDAPHVAIVNQAFIRQFMHSASPIGQTTRTVAEPNYPSTVLEIIGTIPDTKYNDIRGETPPMAFVPAAQFPEAAQGPWTSILVASDMAPDAVMGNLKREIRAKHPDMVLQMLDFETQIHDGLLRERLMAILSGFFGGLAALLVMVGLYGILSYLVTLRRSEIGVRIALGAYRWQVIALVMGDAGRMLVTGGLAGLVLSLVMGRSASAMLFGLKPYDVATLAFAAVLLAVVAVAASWIPARRASKVDPATVLRCE